MARAQTESDIYDQMHKHLENYNGKIGLTSSGWTEKKRTALRLLADTAGARGDVLVSAGDIGVGDMSHMAGWAPFEQRRLIYRAVDGSQRILDEAERGFPGPDRHYTRADISQLVNIPPAQGGCDVIVCLDVLYHIPDDDLYGAFCQWMADHARRYLLVSYATAYHTVGNPERAGDAGFAWFPRPYQQPAGFELIASYTNAGCGQPQKQALSLLRRTD